MNCFSKTKLLVFFALAFCNSGFADINISVDASANSIPVSPYIYGRNVYSGYGGELIDEFDTLSAYEKSNLETYRQVGLKFLRMNQGNNSTKHNWRKNLSSHPDYYNNVYVHNWDNTAKKILDNLPGVDAMYGFQLAGYAASSNAYNFADWDYKQQYGKNAPQNLDLAGGGSVDGNGNLISAGDYKLYLEEWPADSTVGILNHWQKDLKFDMNRFQYWSMDNEPELWPTAHSDMPLTYTPNTLETPERIINNFVEVAKRAKAIYPDIKLTGPVVANEWLWCNIRYKDSSGKITEGVVTDGSIRYCWLEYFIKRIAEEEKKLGMKLLDVFDIHWYPTETKYEHWINWHRVFFDTTYNYPGANGIKRANEGCKWDESITKEYIFKRIQDWLTKYMGEDHGVTLAFTETDFIESMDVMTRAIVYASYLGTFMDNGVEIFTPWTWREGMYEVLHLFSNYSKENRIPSVSSQDSLVSAYSTINSTKDSMTIILVNRAETSSQNIQLSVNNFKVSGDAANTLTLSNLTAETFVSHTENALKSSTVNVSSSDLENSISLTLAPKSITAVMFASDNPAPNKLLKNVPNVFSVTFENGNWVLHNSFGKIQKMEIFNSLGQQVYNEMNIPKGTKILPSLQKGHYLLRFKTDSGFETQKIAF